MYTCDYVCTHTLMYTCDYVCTHTYVCIFVITYVHIVCVYICDYKPLVVSPPGRHLRRAPTVQLFGFAQLPPSLMSGIVFSNSVKPGPAEQQKFRGSSAHLRSAKRDTNRPISESLISEEYACHGAGTQHAACGPQFSVHAWRTHWEVPSWHNLLHGRVADNC